jgi:hypothetical protein
METNERNEQLKQSDAGNTELNVTPLFDEEGNLLEHEEAAKNKNSAENDEDTIGSSEGNNNQSETPQMEEEIADNNTISEPADAVLADEIVESTSTEQEVLAETEDTTIAEPEAEAVAETKEATIDEPEAEAVAETEEATIDKPEAEAVAESEDTAIAEPKAEVVAESEDTAINEPEAEAVAETEEAAIAEPEAEVVAETEEAAIAQPEAEVVAETEEAAIAQPEAEVVAETEETAIAEPEAEVVAEIEEAAIAQTEAEVVAETEPAPIAQTEAEVVAETEEAAIAQTEDHGNKEIGEDKTEKKQQEPVTSASTDEESDSEDDDVDDDEIEDHADYSAFSKEELVVALEELVSGDDTMLHRQKAGKIRIAFIETVKSQRETAVSAFLANGGNETDFQWVPDEMQIRFNEALALYKQKKQQHLERLEEVKKENLTKKLEMLDQIKELINSEEPLKKTYDEFRGIQDKWREIGNVPKSEVGNLWQSYHFLVEKFFDKVKINNELRDLDMKKNMERKIELCEKAEELLLESSVLKSFKQLQRYHAEWKEIGLVPHDKKDELWERFKATTEKINERRQEYYEKLHQEQENNYGVKRALCEKLEELMTALPVTAKEWQVMTDEINELMKMWRSIGPAPRQHNDEIWKRFKGQVDHFYAQKKEHFNAVKDEQVNNYNLKLDLCQQAEAMQESTDWRETTEELITLQQEWKKIGPVPRRHSDKIWKRFRAACDVFFERKQTHFSKQKASEEDNLAIKEGLIEQIKQMEFGEENREEALEKLKEIQRTFLETGHVPFRKKNDINGAFREAINQKLDQLKINHAEISQGMPRPRRDNRDMRPSRGGDNRLERGPGREQTMIINKITKMKSDIALWENNIGFLANSAAAEVLKQEFDKKIQSTKDEITLLEAKLKMMQQESDSKE